MIWTRLKGARWLAVTDEGDYHIVGVLPAGQLTLQYGVVYVPRHQAQRPVELGKRSQLANAQLLAAVHLRGDYQPEKKHA